MSQYKVLNNFAQEFSSSTAYVVGDLTMYLGVLYKCTADHQGAWDSTHFEHVSLKEVATKTEANPSGLTGNEPELLGLEVDGTKYQSLNLSKGDGVGFSLNTISDYTLVNSYSSYNRMGKVVIFICSFDIVKNNSVNAPIAIGTFTAIPNDIFTKLVGGSYLVEENTKAYIDGQYSKVDAASVLEKGNNNTLTLTLETTNLIVNQTYHIRHMSMFLISDNIDVDAPNPVLDNNSWNTIEKVAKAGETTNYWSVGDTKTDLGTDGVIRTFRIVDIEQDGSIVFEEVMIEAFGVQWNAITNIDDNDCYNNYYISDMRNTHLPATLLKFSNDLQAVITTTNVKVAKDGTSNTILTLTDKLFLEAEKEVGYSVSSHAEEQAVLSTYSYWNTHTSYDDHIKYKNSAGDTSSWWLRSPCSSADRVCYIRDIGKAGGYSVFNLNRFAPCFRIGTAQTGGLGPYVAISSVLENNSWDVIRQVAEAGDASNYWSVGDTKTDLGADGVTRTFRIVDMSGLYGKHVVFEQVGLEGTDGTGATGVVWDADNLNDYLASDMNVTVLPGVVTRYSSSLQGALTNTTVKVAENGDSSTIVDVTNKLFLEAEKEVGYTPHSRTEEQAVLTTYAYWSTHTSANDHIKYNQANSAVGWWLRSPCSGYTNNVCGVNSNGNAGNSAASLNRRFTPCFSF